MCVCVLKVIAVTVLLVVVVVVVMKMFVVVVVVAVVVVVVVSPRQLHLLAPLFQDLIGVLERLLLMSSSCGVCYAVYSE